MKRQTIMFCKNNNIDNKDRNQIEQHKLIIIYRCIQENQKLMNKNSEATLG